MDINITPQTPENESHLQEPETYLNEAIAEYLYTKEGVATAFLFGVIKMGSILYKHREELKKTGKWLEFCSRTGIHISQANQQIRMYELSLENTRIDIIKKMITNWTKLNMFMSLDDDMKEEVLDLVESGEIHEDISANEFRDVVSDLKGIEVSPAITGGRNPLHEDSKFAADTIRNATGLSHSSTPFLEAYSSIQKGIEILSQETYFPDDEENEIQNLLKNQIKDLSDIIWTIGYNSSHNLK